MAKRTANKQKEITSSVQLDIKADTPAYYVNYISVSHTAYDLTLTVTKVPSPLAPEQLEAARTGKPIVVEAILQIIVPPLLVDGLIKALVDQKEKYEKTASQQVKNNEIQHQHIKLAGTIH